MNNFIYRTLLLLDRWTRSKKIFWIIFVTAILTRLLGFVIGGVGGHAGDDDGSYRGMALHMLDGKGLFMEADHFPSGKAYAWLPPGMAVVFYFSQLLFGYNDIPLRLFIILFSAVAVVFLYLLACKIFSRRVAAVAALTWALYPPQWFWESRINPHTFATNFFIIAIYLLFVVWEKPSAFLSFLIGLIWSVMTLMRGEYSSGILIAIGAGYFAIKDFAQFFRMTVFLLVGFFLGMAPWVIRNYVVIGKPLLISSNYADNLWYVFNPNYQFIGGTVPFGQELKDKLFKSSDEVARAKIIVEDAKSYAKKYPKQAVKRIVVNFLNYWRPWLSPTVAKPAENVIYVISWIPIFILFLLGLGMIPWRSPHWLFITGFISYSVFTHLFFYVIVRYRETLFPLILLIALLPIMKFFDKEEETAHVSK